MGLLKIWLTCSVLLSHGVNLISGEAEPEPEPEAEAQNFFSQPESNGFFKLPQQYQQKIPQTQNYQGEYPFGFRTIN
jgi:hypothetical protein